MRGGGLVARRCPLSRARITSAPRHAVIREISWPLPNLTTARLEFGWLNATLPTWMTRVRIPPDALDKRAMTPRTKPAPVALINHVALVVDGSGSMSHLSEQVVTIGDQLVTRLAEKSTETDQETRISLYVFEGQGAIRCHTYDKDVLRMPSLRGLYQARNDTPLIDATLKAIEDLSQTATLYGDHAFLVYVLTDGQENASRATARDLAQRIGALDDNWTLVCFVPTARESRTAAYYGFPAENVQIWEVSARGMRDVGTLLDKTVSTYYSMRSQGVRGSRNLFQLDVAGLTAGTLARKLTPLGYGQYRLYEVTENVPIAEFVETKLKRPYRLGEGYYQLIKSEKIQAQKQVAIYDRTKGALYVGDAARQILGLPEREVKVQPEQHVNFDIFVQSTSVNRKLLAGQKLVILS